jgi:hypothetical protein
MGKVSFDMGIAEMGPSRVSFFLHIICVSRKNVVPLQPKNVAL